ARFGDIGNCCKKNIRIFILQGYTEVLCNRSFAVQIICSVKLFKTIHPEYPRTSLSAILPVQCLFSGCFLCHHIRARAKSCPFVLHKFCTPARSEFETHLVHSLWALYPPNSQTR